MKLSPRQGRILALLRTTETMGVGDLAQRLEVSEETMRRDLTILAEGGAVLRGHGTASLPPAFAEAPFARRMRENRAAKEAVARCVAATIRDGDSIMLDTGTTTSLLAQALTERRRLTVVTNSSDIARVLATINGNKVYMAGGALRSDNGAAFGFSAIEFVSRFSVDHAVVTAGAVNAEKGVLDYDLEEAQFGRAVLACGKRRVVATDASKFGRGGLVQVCGFDMVDELVSDLPPPEDLAKALSENGARIRIAAP